MTHFEAHGLSKNSQCYQLKEYFLCLYLNSIASLIDPTQYLNKKKIKIKFSNIFFLLFLYPLIADTWQKKKISIQIGLQQEWNDYNLRWNDSEYGGVKDLRITPNKLWKPDVLMYNR